MTEEQTRLTKEFRLLTENWIKEHNLSCDTCALRTDSNKDKCKSKTYCIVKHGHGVVAYIPLENQGK